MGPFLSLTVAGCMWGTVFVKAHLTTENLNNLTGLLEWTAPLGCAVGLMGLLVAFVFCRRFLGSRINLFGGRQWAMLTVMLIAALIIRLNIAPATERLYFDEHAYLQIAREIIDEGRARAVQYGIIQEGALQCKIGSYTHWAAGWPTLLSGFLRLTEYATWTGMAVNSCLFMITAVLVGLTATLIFRSSSIGFFAAVIYAVIPANQVWSLTNVSEIFAAFGAVLTVFASVLSARNVDIRVIVFYIAALVTVVYARNEMIMMFPISIAFVLFLGGWKSLQKACIPISIMLICLLPQGLHLGLVSRSYDPIVTDSSFQVSYIFKNALSLIHYFLHEPVAAFAVLLSFYGIYQVRSHRAVVPLVLWGLVFLILPVYYFAGNYDFPGGERFALAWLPPVSILAGAGIFKIHEMLFARFNKKVVLLLFSVLFLSSMIWTSFHASFKDRKTAVPRADTAFLRKALRAVPNDAVVVTTYPSTVIAEGRSAIFILLITSDPKLLENIETEFQGRLYYVTSPSSFPDYWPQGREAENRLLTIFKAEPVMTELSTLGKRILYRLRLNNMS